MARKMVEGFEESIRTEKSKKSYESGRIGARQKYLERLRTLQDLQKYVGRANVFYSHAQRTDPLVDLWRLGVFWVERCLSFGQSGGELGGVSYDSNGSPGVFVSAFVVIKTFTGQARTI